MIACTAHDDAQMQLYLWPRLPGPADDIHQVSGNCLPLGQEALGTVLLCLDAANSLTHSLVSGCAPVQRGRTGPALLQECLAVHAAQEFG